MRHRKIRKPYLDIDGQWKIPLTHGLVALVSACDVAILSRYNWSAHPRHDGRLSAVAWMGDQKQHTMARFLLDAPLDRCVDHCSGDTLDNRRENLRLASLSESSCNRRRPRYSLSPYKGVRAKRRKWQAVIQVNKRRMSLGCFDTAEAAAMAYDAACLRFHGTFAHTNVMEGLL